MLRCAAINAITFLDDRGALRHGNAFLLRFLHDGNLLLGALLGLSTERCVDIGAGLWGACLGFGDLLGASLITFGE